MGPPSTPRPERKGISAAEFLMRMYPNRYPTKELAEAAAKKYKDSKAKK